MFSCLQSFLHTFFCLPYQVDAELIEIILHQFNQLDTDGSGTLDMDDIRAASAEIEQETTRARAFTDQIRAYHEGKEPEDSHHMRVGVHMI